MAGNEHSTPGRHVVRDADRLLGIARVVAHDEHQFLPEDAARRVDVRDRFLGAAAELLAERGIAAAHRTGDTDNDIGAGRCNGDGEDRGEK
jgi:hypothetical protein